MDVRFSVEQQALRGSARAVVDRLGPKTVRDLEDSERRAKLDAAVEASGWRELRSLDDQGRPVASGVEVAIIAEELGRGVADTAFLGPSLATELRRLTAAPAAASTETVALSADLSCLGTSGPAERPLAFDSNGSDQALVAVAAADRLRLGQVPTSDAAHLTDLTRCAMQVAEDRIELLEPAVTVSEASLRSWTAFGLAIACADLVGIMRGVIEMSAGYVASRRQYGVPVGSFQAVQHLLADAHVAMEGSRSIALHAAWAVDALPGEEALAAASAAKAYCSRAARDVCETGIQVHGGIGNTWECMAHVYLRRALVTTDLLGGVGRCLDRVLAHQGIGV